MRQFTALVTLLAVFLFFGCEEEPITDLEKPAIELIFPQSCDTIYIGESFTLRTLLSDNEKLSSYSVELHNNFDQHGHSTESVACDLDEAKAPVNPFYYRESYEINGEPGEFTTNLAIEIPDGVDEGDYHVNISVIDKSGWQTFRIVSVKILNR